jgi:glutathione S-transferase
MDWAQTAWQPDFMGGVFWGFYRTPEAQRNNAAIRRAVSACGAHLRLLEQQLGDKAFVASDALTLADIPIGSMMFRYFTLEIERPSLPRVEDWYARLCARPAFQRHIMLPYDELFGRLAF